MELLVLLILPSIIGAILALYHQISNPFSNSVVKTFCLENPYSLQGHYLYWSTKQQIMKKLILLGILVVPFWYKPNAGMLIFSVVSQIIQAIYKAKAFTLDQSYAAFGAGAQI